MSVFKRDEMINFLKERERYHALMASLSNKHVDIRFQHLAIRNELYSIIEMLKTN